MSLVRQHRARFAALAAVAVIEAAGVDGPAELDPASTEYDQMRMRLVLDLRRLKDIQSIERKIDAKREMLGEYDAWISGVLAAAAESGRGVQDEVLATIMIWRIDVADYAGAMPLIEYVLRWNLALPERYSRTAATLIVEEIADAALKRISQGEDFPLDVLTEIELLTVDEDMHDEVRAKLMKAIGLAHARIAEGTEENPDGPAGAQRAAQEQALTALKRARELHEKCGVAKAIEKIEREFKKGEGSAPPPAQSA